MQNLLFGTLQSYAWILEYARHLTDHEPKDEMPNRIEHQINIRIYNNALCGMLYMGYPFEIVEENEIKFVVITIDGALFQCPLNTVSNVLRMEYDSLIKPKLESRKESGTTEDRMKLENNFISKIHIPNDAQDGGEKMSKLTDKPDDAFLMQAGISDLDDFVLAPAKPYTMLELDAEASQKGYSDMAASASVESQPTIEKRSVETTFNQTDGIKGQKASLLQQKAGKFKPKTQPMALSIAQMQQSAITSKKGEKDQSGGFFSAIFGGAKKRQESILERSMAEETEDNKEKAMIQKKDTSRDISHAEAYPEEKENLNYSQDGGKLFKHIHEVTLRKKFAGTIAGPYRFIFWPIRILERYPGKTWADFLVHITEPNGNETVMCTDGKYKELAMKMDGKEFNMYATWTGGIFESHLSLQGKTESMFILEEDLFKEEPEEASRDCFLDQFRYERKGQPKHFIVPFKNSNRGEMNIPIVGYVELDGKKYPLERRESNTLRYRYKGDDKIIRGHWEKGGFVFAIEDANCMIWEEDVNT